MTNYFLIILICIISLPVSFIISKKLKLYDYPISNRKIHKKPILIGGGIFLITCVMLYFLLSLFQNNINLSIQYNFKIFLFPIILFFLGIYDDKFNLNSNIKLILSTLLYLILLLIDESLLINNLKFSFTNKTLILGNFSIFFTVFCFVVFLNALNMFDGIDGQSAIYSIIIILLINSIGGISDIIFLILVCLIIYLFFNIKKKTIFRRVRCNCNFIFYINNFY